LRELNTELRPRLIHRMFTAMSLSILEAEAKRRRADDGAADTS